jgi:hypothetical protein
MKAKPIIKIQSDGTEVLSVCGWCWPGETVFQAFPNLRGYKISHGICPKHEIEFEKEEAV